ncbi:MAG: PAS domain S-box protein [Oscillatoriaceae cyanobacterium Prado104]|jgi:PAS domain S-box-containing protein|nr:PAS domain S-box protein [Oscillatoriaceae cyanobacterium Prado104]
MSRILLSIDRYYPCLPVECLKSEHEVIVPERVSLSSSEFSLPDISFDLCILDEATFDRVRPLLGPLKRASEPIFLPFLLVCKALTPGEREPPLIAEFKDSIDDAILLPVEPFQLQLRVDNLLERRRLSRELHKLQETAKEAINKENLLLDSLQVANAKLQREIVRRNEVETALRENSYLDSLMNAMPDIVCFKDGDGRWQEANQAILDVFELSADEYRGLKDFQLGELSPFYREALRYCEASDRIAWEKGMLSRGEEVISRSDGSVKIYDVIKVPLFYSDGRRKSIVILGRDITERKQAQEEILRLASIVESSGDAIVGKTPDGTIQSWNAGAQKIYGYTVAEVKGRSIEILALSDRPNEMSQILANIRAGGASIDHYETVHLRKDGKQIDVSLTISPIKDSAGTVIGVSTIARDITDKKRVEKALEQLRHQNELILFSAGEGICGLNKCGKVTFVNPAAVRMAGYSGKELIERPLWESLHRKPENNQKILQENLSPPTPNADSELTLACSPNSANCQVLATLQDGKTRRVTDEVFWRPDGTSFPVEYVVTPMRERGEIIGAVVTFKDITDRLAIDRMKDEFISVVSHELRTPMTSIHGALGLLNSGLLHAQPHKAKRMLEIAVTNTERLVRLIDDILDLERMESSCDSAVKEICNAADLMRQAADAMQGMALQAGVTLSVTPATACLRATPDRLIQVLTNLLSNAIKFSPAGATVCLSGEVAPKQGIAANPHAPTPSSELRIAVQDRGRGIPPDKLEVVFERFQQVDAPERGHSGGTGLGLAICRSIVQQHGGRIWVESVLGEGSTFFLTLPVFVGGEIQVC